MKKICQSAGFFVLLSIGFVFRADLNIAIMTQATSDKLVTLEEIAAYTNNVNLDQEIIAFDAFSPGNQITHTPIRIDALAIILCTKGNCTLKIDLKTYEVKPNTLVVLQPQNYLTYCEGSPDAKCHLVVCSLRIVENIMPKLTDILPMMMLNRLEPVCPLTNSEAVGIISIYHFLKSRLQRPKTPFLKQAVLCVLQAAVFEMMDIRNSHADVAHIQNSRKEEIMARFLIAVCENFKKERQVSFYSTLLCITPKHLSAVVKEISGRTAGEWIENYVIMEAKVLLSHTDLTIKEIASRLNFANQSFFGKYFKHLTGLSPTEFRDNNK